MLPRFVERLAPLGVDCLVVDDSSPDGTGGAGRGARGLAPLAPWLHRAEKDGLGAAYRAGFAWALARGYARVGQMDSESLIARGARTARSRRWTKAPTSRSARASCAAAAPRAGRAGGSCRAYAACLPARTLLRVPVRDLTGGLQALARRRARADRRRLDAVAGVRLPGRDDDARRARGRS